MSLSSILLSGSLNALAADLMSVKATVAETESDVFDRPSPPPPRSPVERVEEDEGRNLTL
jgi:hypothetical protein